MRVTESTKLSTLRKLNIKTVAVVIAIIVGLASVPAQTIKADSLAKTKITVKKQKSKLWGRKYVTGFKISWKKVKGAKGYKVYAYGVASKKWRCIKTTKKTSYTLTRLISKSKAKIKVRAYNNSDGSTTYGKFSKSVTCKAKDEVYKVNNDGEMKKSFFDRFSAEQAFVLQNKMRKDAGVSNIKWSERLYELCEIRAKQISKDFSHDKFDSTSKSYLKDNYGITEVFVMHSEEDGNYGVPIIGTENISTGQMDYKEAMESWKNSKPHYNNLIGKDHKVGAIACYKGKGTGHFWVAIFGYMDVDKVVEELKTKN
jgi:uncharacterized protein YkwD